MFIDRLENLFNEKPMMNDLFFIILDSLRNKSFTFIQILHEVSNCYGITSSEGCFYTLDKDLEFPEDFERVSVFLGEFETAQMNLNEFMNCITFISDIYIAENPSDTEKVKQYLKVIYSRYENVL